MVTVVAVEAIIKPAAPEVFFENHQCLLGFLTPASILIARLFSVGTLGQENFSE